MMNRFTPVTDFSGFTISLIRQIKECVMERVYAVQPYLINKLVYANYFVNTFK